MPASHGPAAAAAFGASRPRAYTVTGIDRYLECPFKYFARTVLELPEEALDEPGLSPKERGRFVHEVFRAFFTEWQAGGGGAVGIGQLDAARTLFATVVEERLQTLPSAEAPLERMRLLGTVAAPGLGEIVLAAEAIRPTPVVERLLEFPFDGEFTLTSGGEERQVRLRGKADRVDLLADGRFRVIDYKIGRAPDNSIQLPVYSLCLRQHFARQGRCADIGEAFYVAFGERAHPVESVLDEGPRAAAALDQAQERVLSAIDGIERGEFPPRPATPRLCGFCAFATVCRKDVVVAD
jgi:ATP-dependent helicase/DNAse subunit B